MHLIAALRQHDMPLLLLALGICAIGSIATVQLTSRVLNNRQNRISWVLLTAVNLAAMVWCTHFISMMAMASNASLILDPSLTFLSFLVVLILSVPGLLYATDPTARHGRILGGLATGLAVCLMHYTGMAAYRVQSHIQWNATYVVLSIVFASGFSALAFAELGDGGNVSRKAVSSVLLALAVVTMHFTGMAAMDLPMQDMSMQHGMSSIAMKQLAITTGLAGSLIIACAVISAIIASRSQTELIRDLHHLAFHDHLTDLPNRSSMMSELSRRVAAIPNGSPRLAVVAFNLYGFKNIRHAYGQEDSDCLLRTLGARLSALLQPGEYIARLEGDDFAAIIPYDGPKNLANFLATVQNTLHQPIELARSSVVCAAAIGIALAPVDGRDSDTLLANADRAMSRARGVRSTQPCYYDHRVDAEFKEHRHLTHRLQTADESQFEIHYQPQAVLATGEVLSFEALMRWKDPVDGFIPPDVFIPIAEECGEMTRLGSWVLHQACKEAAMWPGTPIVAVNLSAVQLADPNLIDEVRSALGKSGLPATRLELELTETAIIRDRQQALQQLRTLKEMGVSISLDDFGTGYSTLDILRSFPFDRIKLDRSFIAQIEESEEAVAVLNMVASLGNTLRMPVVAEGIETEAQREIITRAGCGFAQGWLFGRPQRVPAMLQVRTAVSGIAADFSMPLMPSSSLAI